MSENQEAVKTEEVKPVPAYRYVVSVRFKEFTESVQLWNKMTKRWNMAIMSSWKRCGAWRWARSSAICAMCRCTPRTRR